MPFVRRILRGTALFWMEMRMKNQVLQTPGRLSTRAKVLLVLTPPVCVLFALVVGRMQISLTDVVNAVLCRFGAGRPVSTRTETVLWTIRLPRILLALLVGAGLSVSGCVFQSLFANPLATPDTLGVASGASFGAALALLLGLPLAGVQLCSLLAGIAAMGLTVLSGRGGRSSRVSLVLAGIMIGSLFSSLISLVKFTADTESQLPSISYWLMGSLSSAGYPALKVSAPPILLGILVLYLLRWRLNLLPLSDDEARTSGANIRALRAVVIVCATGITAACVSMCGQVGWVGLLIPHLCRMRFGDSHVALLPACISLGAAFMVLVDTAARSLSASEIPVSVLTAIIGAPFFILLMRRSGGWNL